MDSLRRLLRDEEGQDLIEYALLASLIAIVSVAALNLLGPKVSAFYQTVAGNF